MTAQEIAQKWQEALRRLKENRPEDREWRSRVYRALLDYLRRAADIDRRRS